MAEEEKNPCGGAAAEATVQTEAVAKEKGRGRETISASAAVVREKLCRRCKETFDAASNTATSCRFHPSFFVCRRHDDQKRYYELGPDDPPYAAKFYDCCGAEDPDAQGCTADFHISYDDD